MSNPTRRPPLGSVEKEPPEELPEEGILLGYSLEHERRTAPIGFTYGSPDAEASEPPGSAGTPTLDPILHTGGGHLMTIAPTGAGKGISCIVPTLLRYPGPVIVIDPKGENYAVTAERRRALGQDVVVLDPVGITEADEPGALNPLDLVDLDDDQPIDDSAALASLLSGGIQKEDPRNLFWYQRGEQLLTGIIQFVAVTRSGRERSLSEVRRILNLPAPEFVQLANTQMTNCPDPDVRQVAGTLVNPAEEMIGSILGMAQNSLGFLRGTLMRASTDASSFDLADVTAGAPLSIYIVIPPDKLESQRNLLRLWIGALMSALMRRRAPVPRSTLLVLDEAAQLGPLEQLRQAVTLMRGYGLQTWSFWQDVSQLLNLYPRDWETMYNNCRVHQAFGFTTLKAATASCDLLGFHAPLEALQLDVDEMILSVSGDEAVIAQKPNYLTDPAFEGLYAPNPFYTRSTDLPPAPRKPKRVYVRPAFETPGERMRGAEADVDDESDEEDDVGSWEEFEALVGGSTMTDAAVREADAEAAEARRSTSLLDPLPGLVTENAPMVPRLIDVVVDRLGGTWNPITAHARGISLPFWDGHHIVEITDPRQRQLVLLHSGDARPFGGGEAEWRTLVRQMPPALDDETVASYVRIFFHFGRHEGSRVRIVETLDQLAHWTSVPGRKLQACEEKLHPCRVTPGDDEWRVDAVELFEDVLREVTVVVGADGRIRKVERGPVLGTLPPLGGYPTFDLDGNRVSPEEAARLREIHGYWEVLTGAERRSVLADLGDEREGLDEEAPMLRRPLRCCPGYDMIRVSSPGRPRQDLLMRGTDLTLRVTRGMVGFLRVFVEGLVGSSGPRLILDDPEAVKEYVRLLAWFASGPDDYLIFLDRFDQLPLHPVARLAPEEHERLLEAWRPMSVEDPADDDPPTVVARVSGWALKDGHATRCRAWVHGEGRVDFETTDDGRLLVLRERGLTELLSMPLLGIGSATGLRTGVARERPTEDAR